MIQSVIENGKQNFSINIIIIGCLFINSSILYSSSSALIKHTTPNNVFPIIEVHLRICNVVYLKTCFAYKSKSDVLR